MVCTHRSARLVIGGGAGSDRIIFVALVVVAARITHIVSASDSALILIDNVAVGSCCNPLVGTDSPGSP